ncbi:MAG: glycoside hydrolase family 18 protein [Planctomycetes bacterium]|nr:glycoside hydrolase family 18 protein [Planctomycetota bacterium]
MRLLSLLALVALAPLARAADPKDAGPRVVGYYTEWSVYDRKFDVGAIPAAKLTHVNYAFAKIVNGECALFDSYAAIDKAYPGDTWEPGALRGNFKQLQLLKKKHPHLKTLISVGGWTLSSPFSDLATTDPGRKKFASSCVAFMTKYGFDGVDIDWEYPVGGGLETNKTRPEDKANYTLLLAELRAHLDARGKLDKRAYLLTIAAPAGPKVFANLELDKVHKHLDWLNLMSYDFHGGWSEHTNFNAPLFASKLDPTKDDVIRTKFNVSAAVEAYLAAGVPAEKLVMGVPFYGRGWTVPKGGADGLFQPPAKQLPRGTWENGVFDYKDIAANYLGKRGKRFWHDEAKVPWLYDEKTGLVISYDDPESMKLKGAFAREKKLGGAMIWELNGDDAKNALLDALRAGLSK